MLHTQLLLMEMDWLELGGLVPVIQRWHLLIYVSPFAMCPLAMASRLIRMIKFQRRHFAILPRLELVRDGLVHVFNEVRASISAAELASLPFRCCRIRHLISI